MLWLPDDPTEAEYLVIAAIQRGAELFVITEGPAAEQAPAPLTRVAATVSSGQLQWLNANGHASRVSRLLLTTAFEEPEPATDEIRIVITVNGEPIQSATLRRRT